LAQVWDEIHQHGSEQQADGPMKETICHNKLWQEKNLSFEELSGKGNGISKQSVIANLMLILMQTLLQLPAVFTFVWYLVNQGTGSKEYDSDSTRIWSNLAGIGFQVMLASFYCIWKASCHPADSVDLI